MEPAVADVDADVDLADLTSALRIAVGRLNRRLRAERTEAGLSTTKISALASLEQFGPQSPTALAALERVQPPSMTRVIADLEGLGLAERVPHPSDRRQSVIAVTEAGRHLLGEERRSRSQWLWRALEMLSAAELETIAGALPILERLAES